MMGIALWGLVMGMAFGFMQYTITSLRWAHLVGG